MKKNLIYLFRDPIAVAMDNNHRLILQFREVIRQRQQQQNSLSGAQVAHMVRFITLNPFFKKSKIRQFFQETELQRKMTENLAIAQQQKRLVSLRLSLLRIIQKIIFLDFATSGKLEHHPS